MPKFCLIFLILSSTFLTLATAQTVIVTELPQPLVSASEATLLTTPPLLEESLKKYKLNEELNEFNEIPLEEAEISNISKTEQNKMTKSRFKIAKVFTNCTRELFEMRVELNRPFHGLLYAKDFPHECRARGTSEMNISLRLPTSGCGVRVEPRHDGSMELSVRIMMQMEEKLRQSSDILKTVKCKLPVTAMGMLLAGVEGKSKNGGLRHGRMQSANLYLAKSAQNKQQLNAADMATTHLPPSSSSSSSQSATQHFTNAHSSQTPRVRIWLELGGPDGSGSVVVGQATTLTVRAIVPGTMGVRIVDCAALDGLGESTQQLLDERGCPIDEQVMPALHTRSKHLEEGWSKHNDDDLIEKTYTATFPAFKFPDRERLHVSCGVQLCKGHCPNINCRTSEKLVLSSDKHLARIEVFNSLAVTAPQIEVDRLRYDRRHNMSVDEYPPYVRPLINDGTLCLSVSKLALSFCILGLIFLVAVIVAVTSLIRSRRRTTVHSCGTISSNSARLHRTDVCNSMFSSSSESAQSAARFGSKFFMPYYPNTLPYGRVY
ncbi:uncharacterized protein cyr [Calliphora vicina]|uniref:uncharacterized protein cyr n=1 Tax=Calliphora vicina TaxID=7373 RepID=UPI00325BB892